MTDVRRDDVDIPTEDGVADAYLAHPADGRPHPGVLFYQDAYGPRPHLRSMADRLAAAGYTVLLPNVFYRLGRAPVVDLPEFIDPGADPAIWERLGPMLAGLTPDLVRRDAGAYLRWLADSPLVTDGPVALTGYCMGSRLALWTAGAHPDRVAAAAGFHGGALATDDPDSPHLEAPRITAELYFGHADEDASLPPAQIARFEEALTPPVCATPARSTPAPTTATPRQTPPPTTGRPTSGTGRPCSTCSSARSDRPGPVPAGRRVPGRCRPGH